MAKVFDLLRAAPGDDPVFLTILTREGDEVDMALPSASLEDALVARLQAAISHPLAASSKQA